MSSTKGVYENTVSRAVMTSSDLSVMCGQGQDEDPLRVVVVAVLFTTAQKVSGHGEQIKLIH